MRRWILRPMLAVLVLAVLLLAAGWWLLRGSLPVLDGAATLPGLAGPVQVERDAQGTVTIVAASEADAMRALGFVHAQERYFGMDLARRAAAGELAALFGPRALAHDRRVRVHRLRARVREHFDAFAGDHRAALAAYRDGVNAGLEDLRVRPWPYLLLRTAPVPWSQEDTAMVGYAMFFDLQDEDNARELALWRMREVVPPPLYRLLAPEGGEWDAPLMGAARAPARLPDVAQLDLRTLDHVAPTAVARAAADADARTIGSNNFAVSGALTADGRAIVADDMHLGLRAPNIWFRVRLRYRDPRAPQGEVDVTGVSLPGVPGVIVGSNRHVAWGFTNSYGDWADWIALPDGAAVATFEEEIEVAGADADLLRVEESRFGPVLERSGDGRRLALHWQAHEPGALALGLLDVARAGSVEDLVALAPRLGVPAQNLVAGDTGGAIAWTIAGPALPRTLDGRALPDLAPIDPTRNADFPPPRGGHPALLGRDRLWTANARVADGDALAAIGDGGYDLGARQRQIRDALHARERFTEADLLAIQLDDRALFLARWHRLLRQVIEREDDPADAGLDRATRAWSGRAAIDAIDYRLVRAFRGEVLQRVRDGLLGPVRARLGAEFEAPGLPQFETTLWALVEQRPPHLLPPAFASWDALLADARAAVRPADTGAAGSWGERDTTAICHPLAAALPALLGERLCMPREPLPGDVNMPRVQGPDFGASERMVVAPGHEEDGFFHMPGGQSGHPLSPFWGAGHADWAQGRASPFLPGAARHRLQLDPLPQLRPGG
ncbi:penicillin acylase family protein [Coralloluteibacterium stylophorae]|uniref:Penicillin acylase family protein n=1 Tax=Coralloluteibacterium stylophorae TaxID=1776034 RepID=A0A8J8AYE4_9GAMM|nr:penicillin acylase family protein [Coralloluteibacterium stylophorae]MBS7456361.1 penicillin acylase family protein [Coralloluteibacterium stylophorae]